MSGDGPHNYHPFPLGYTSKDMTPAGKLQQALARQGFSSLHVDDRRLKRRSRASAGRGSAKKSCKRDRSGKCKKTVRFDVDVTKRRRRRSR